MENLPLENHTNWLDLPRDAMLIILIKLTTSEILESVQFVWKLWYNMCKEPSMWRTIHINNYVPEPRSFFKCENMVVIAVDRSAGGLIDLDIEGFGCNKLLSFVAFRSGKLKRLRLSRCNGISAYEVINALQKLTSLKELELTLCPFHDDKIGTNTSIIQSCPSLNTFKFNKMFLSSPSEARDEEALAIARRMPELRHLQLIVNTMTSVGLTAILDACPHLQSLDLRACFNLDVRGNISKRLSQEIKNFQHPIDFILGHKSLF